MFIHLFIMIKPTFITKYKPYLLNDFDMDNDMLQMFKFLLEVDQLNLLLVGNTNSGKTTLLHALIREYYQLQPDSNIPENNILFINSLKEQGIQYFRNEMKTFCQSFCSIHNKKKMVIIDDIDNINEQSQQVFRNYIDKYKHNIHFITACTNMQKVNESIQSRLQIMKIPNFSTEQNILLMNKIIHNENLTIDEESKQYLLHTSNKSIRLLINLLEKIYIYNNPITLDVCRKICSNISNDKFENYFTYLKKYNIQEALKQIYYIHDYGYSVIDILDYMFAFIKITDMLTEEVKYQIIPILCKYITIFHNTHEDSIELALFTNNVYDIIVKEYKHD